PIAAIDLPFGCRVHCQSIATIQQPNCVLDGCGAQVYVALSCREVLMPCEFLNRSCRCAAHGEMRTKRVSQLVRPSRPRRKFGCVPVRFDFTLREITFVVTGSDGE